MDSSGADLLDRYRQVLDAHASIADKIIALRAEERLPRCGGFQAERLTEDKYGAERMIRICVKGAFKALTIGMRDVFRQFSAKPCDRSFINSTLTRGMAGPASLGQLAQAI